ncbi:synaptonemal complex protein 2-like isoform X3 [Dendropsophus ebraccatus]|uniref:synaptonemal complex protein 2-like isoform X3 n=1 Tax=Dendropsophus ebraccatus TaxID=150705 RepID=UPI00383227A0
MEDKHARWPICPAPFPILPYGATYGMPDAKDPACVIRCLYPFPSWMETGLPDICEGAIAEQSGFAGEDKLNPEEEIPIPSEYYLETLITEASKGQGFQKISELFEDKVVCLPQRYSKGLLNQLDRLINRELDRNEFQHVSLLLKCIQLFCKSEYQEGCSSLIQQGMVSKMVLWFERTLEFLKICNDHKATISALVEDFYDTTLVISKCDPGDGVKQLLDTFLYTLGFIILEEWPPYSVRLEALKTFNFILDHISREEKKKLNSSEDMCTLMQGLARKLLEVGDYEIQVAITESLCRLTTRKMRENCVQKWFEDSFFVQAFKEINDKDFETDCRKFLNSLNSRLTDTKRVHTFPCISVSTDVGELRKPKDDKLECFWIDFNVGSQNVSFYIQNSEGPLWDTVRMQKECLSGYSLEECNGQKLLTIHLKIPLSVNNKAVKYIKIQFELEHDIQNAIAKTYGEDLQMQGNCERTIQVDAASSTGASDAKTANGGRQNGAQSTSGMDQSSPTGVRPASQQRTPRSSKQQNKFRVADYSDKDSNDGQMFPQFPLDTPRLLEYSGSSNLSEISGKVSLPTMEKKTPTPKQQSAEKRPIDVYEFGNSSSESASDLGVSSLKKSSSRRKTNANTTRPGSLSSQKTDTKKDDYKGYISSGSEEEWGQEHPRKSSANSADYSRKKQKRKSKLRVLPLSPESSDTEKPQNVEQSLKPLENNKKRKEKGAAESLKFTQLKLPGVSGLLTPGDSAPRTSGTFHLSELDDDTLDPLQEMSSPDKSPHPDPTSRMDAESYTDPFGTLHLSHFDEETVALQEMPSRDLIRTNKPPHTDTTSKMDVESCTDPIGIAEDLKNKRKRTNTEGDEGSSLRPRKLFSSVRASAEMEDDVFNSDSHESDITEGNFISSFENFTEGLKKKMMARYKKMEVRAQEVLKDSHLHLTNLMTQIQQSNFQKLDHFRTVVAKELCSLDAETRALKELEEETLNFWEAQTVKINEFCTNQRQRFEAMDRTINDSLNSLKKRHLLNGA